MLIFKHFLWQQKNFRLSTKNSKLKRWVLPSRDVSGLAKSHQSTKYVFSNFLPPQKLLEQMKKVDGLHFWNFFFWWLKWAQLNALEYWKQQNGARLLEPKCTHETMNVWCWSKRMIFSLHKLKHLLQLFDCFHDLALERFLSTKTANIWNDENASPSKTSF